jgi:hypothetical protein
MKTRNIYLILLTILFTLLTSQSVARAQDRSADEAAPAETTSSSSFTYQGQVLQKGEPVNGACDFQFSLWDTANAGNQIGSLQAIANIPVVNGLFVVSLDFGSVFEGEQRWLEMAVSCPAGGAFALVTPRQELTATPYAFHAATAPWSGLTGVPSGFADGVDDGTS